MKNKYFLTIKEVLLTRSNIEWSAMFLGFALIWMISGVLVEKEETIFRKQKYDINSVVDVEKTPVKITRRGKEVLVDLTAIKIFVPNVMDKPLFIPIGPLEQKGLIPSISEPGERINLIMRLIDRANKQGIKLTDDSFRALMEEDFDKYNPVLEKNSDEVIEETSDDVIVKPEKGTLG